MQMPALRVHRVAVCFLLWDQISTQPSPAVKCMSSNCDTNKDATVDDVDNSNSEEILQFAYIIVF